MAATGRIRSRLALAIVLTALIPVLVAIWLARSMVRQATERFFVPEVGAHLDQALALYQELARTVKRAMRADAAAIARQPELRRAAQAGDAAAVRKQLERLFPQYPDLVVLMVQDANGERLASVDRGTPLDPTREVDLQVVEILGEVPAEPTTPQPGKGSSADEQDIDEEVVAPKLYAVFAAEKARFEERDEMSHFIDTYQRIERRRDLDESSYVYAFAALLGLTILAAIGMGYLLAYGVSVRISRLAAATRRVGAGDLSIRVPEKGGDEIADLAMAFNRMVREVEASRARIEYLQRMGAWQEMARRLAHEIKNPLTPIQLAVQEIHRRYSGEDERYRQLVDSTLEIVQDEVGTLRRLVSEFSEFARVPRAQLQEEELGGIIAGQRERFEMLLSETGEAAPGTPKRPQVQVLMDLPDEPAKVYLDRQMLRRALINLVRNAAQATWGAGKAVARVRLRLNREGEFWVLDIDDDGPGIPDDLRETAFDPYVTTRTEGTGLGLAIVKKIVVEHAGTIQALASPWGGARIRIRLPAAGTPAGRAALESSQWNGPPSTGSYRRPPV